jgi:hypothetical protein
MSDLCPFNWGDNETTFCNDGFPCKYPDKPGKHHCTAYQQPDIIIDVCSSEACKTIYLFEGVNFHLKPCEVQADCPYSGCSRCRKIKPIPDRMAAQAIHYHCNEKEKRDEHPLADAAERAFSDIRAGDKDTYIPENERRRLEAEEKYIPRV